MTYTSEYNDQLAAIIAAINGVTDAGRIHDRPRHGDFRERWVIKINGIEQIRSWEIAPGDIDVNRREQGRRHRYREWTITGAVGLADMAIEDQPETLPTDTNTDASFHVIQRLAGEIADALDVDTTKAGSFIDTDPTDIDPPQVVTIGGGALCWGISLSFVGYTILTP